MPCSSQRHSAPSTKRHAQLSPSAALRTDSLGSFRPCDPNQQRTATPRRASGFVLPDLPPLPAVPSDAPSWLSVVVVRLAPHARRQGRCARTSGCRGQKVAREPSTMDDTTRSPRAGARVITRGLVPPHARGSVSLCHSREARDSPPDGGATTWCVIVVCCLTCAPFAKHISPRPRPSTACSEGRAGIPVPPHAAQVRAQVPWPWCAPGAYTRPLRSST